MILPAIALLFAFGFSDARPQHSKNSGLTVKGCPTGMHIVGVRGTLEEPGHGALQDVVDELKKVYPGSDDIAIEYPAGGITPPKEPGGQPKMDLFKYLSSEAEGYKALKSHLEDYSEQCESTQVLLMGYSQGAHVVGDVLCGNRNAVAGTIKPSIDPFYTYNIRGVVLLGDPANAGQVPWHQGNGTYNGMFNRIDYTSCGPLLSQFGQSWCDEKDFFCEFSKWLFGGSIKVHLQYVLRHKDEIVAQTKKLIDSYEGKVDDFKSKFILQGSFDL